jgi:hypothetical protein
MPQEILNLFQIVKQRASAFASLKNAESLASAKISLLVSLTNGSFGLAVVDDQLVMVEGVFSYCLYSPLTHNFFSAYYVREEWCKRRKTLMDIIDYIHWCNVLPRSAVLPAHSTASISGDGMCGDTNQTVHPSPGISIPLHCTTGYDSPIHFKPFPRTPSWAFRIYTSRLEY